MDAGIAVVFLLIVPYLLGSIPFGLLLTRLAGLGDVRQIGSGNIGATNVMRTGHKGLGVLTFLLDGGKGFAAVWVAQHMPPYPFFVSSRYTDLYPLRDYAAVAGLCAVLGHVFPVWLRFKGGKGVATAIGVLFALNTILGASVCAMWVIIFLVMRVSSLAALVSIGYAWAVAYVLEDISSELVTICLALLIFYTHRANIRRLIEGQELSFGKAKS